MNEAISGTIDAYDQRNGYGHIAPDIPIAEGNLILVHRKSLRHPATAFSLARGQRVLFTTTTVPRGLLATDVRLEVDDMDLMRASSEELAEGVMDTLVADRGFGFIRLSDGRRAFCHVSNLRDSQTLPPKGAAVECMLIETESGLRAVDVVSIESGDARLISSRSSTPRSEDLLAKAVLARDSKDYATARELYQEGMRKAPSVQLILSFAAFEKNQHRREAAMDIYAQGIESFPEIAKLREDAGVLAGGMGHTEVASKYLQSALSLCRSTPQAGETGVLLALARLHYRGDTRASLSRSLAYFRQAKNVAGSMPSSDELSLRLAEIRLQHHRGSLVFSFLHACRFRIETARLLAETTTGADLIASIDNAEINESYGISGSTLFRCVFKSKVTQHDLDDLDKRLTELAQTDIFNDQIAFLILSSVPDELRNSLYRRVDRPTQGHIIVPIAQEALERQTSPLDALRDVLDIWLYRRDLFAHTSPVVGSRFFGRENILATLRNAIAYSKPCGIFGLRKVGKTSLLQECERRTRGMGDLVAYVDLLRLPADVGDARWLYWRIANLLHAEVGNRAQLKFDWRLGGRYEDYLDLPPELPVATAFDSDLSGLLRRIVTSKLNPKPKVVLLLDEIERLLPTGLGKEGGIRGFFEFFSYLRGIAQETVHFAVVVTGANPSLVEVPQFGLRDNPVFNFFEEVYLQLLNPEETSGMIRRLGKGMGMTFGDDGCHRIHRLTGGHPYFVRAFCSYLAKQRRERPIHISSGDVDMVVDAYLENGGKDFREIAARLERDYPEELAVCVELAHAAAPISIKNEDGRVMWSQGSVKHLIGYQLVRIDDGMARLTMELFGRWIQHWHGVEQ